MQLLTTSTQRPVPVEAFKAEVRKVCGVFELEPPRRNGIVNGDISVRRIGQFDAAVIALDALEVTRTARSIREDPGEFFFLLIQDAGHCTVRQGDEAAELSPGDMFLVDSTSPSSFHFHGSDAKQISLHIPRDDIVHRFGDACSGGLSICRDDPLWLAMRAVIAKMMAEDRAQAQLGEAFWGLVGAYLHSTRFVRTDARQEKLLSRALAMIDHYRADPTFGPHELASRLNVSKRVLQRHFRLLGEPPGHRLLNRRLELAYARLSDCNGTPSSQGVTAIALDCGFNDLSYFYREFRKRYGTTPGSILNRR